MSTTRLQLLRGRMASLNVEAILISQPENRRYVSGFTGSSGWLLVTASDALIITDFRYYEQVGRECEGFTLVQQNKTFGEAFRQAVRQAGVGTVAFESRHVTVGMHQDMQDALARKGRKPIAELVAVADVVEPLRAVKDEAEIAAISRAAEITDTALGQALPRFAVGMTEKEAAWQIERAMRELGASGTAFDLIVASGPNAALPHARPSDRPLGTGEPIVIDIGARVDGYASDLTRTICLGKETSKFRRIYGFVRQAQDAALAAVRPGPTGREMDSVAREIIRAAGYGRRFGHGLGHGVGLAVHEAPTLSFREREAQPLAAGMVVTIEPGIYLPGWGGVRIEDLVVVRADGAQVLSKSPK